MAVLGDGVLALGKSVPQLDGLVAGCRDNLTVVSGESYAEHITVVSDEAAGGGTAVYMGIRYMQYDTIECVHTC